MTLTAQIAAQRVLSEMQEFEARSQADSMGERARVEQSVKMMKDLQEVLQEFINLVTQGLRSFRYEVPQMTILVDSAWRFVFRCLYRSVTFDITFVSYDRSYVNYRKTGGQFTQIACHPKEIPERALSIVTETVNRLLQGKNPYDA